MGPGIGVRWTIGELKPRSLEALRLSILGAWRLFGTRAAYAVCVHTLPLAEVRRRIGSVPPAVAWVDITRAWSRSFVFAYAGPGRAEGAAWKLVPPRLFTDRFEIALESAVILWERPRAMEAWLAEADLRRPLLAEDPAPAFGQFAGACASLNHSAAIRGVPPGFDLVAAWKALLRRHPAYLLSAADAQGLQVAALTDMEAPRVVGLEDVTVCSPLPPHDPGLGRCGASFAGLSTRLPVFADGRPADDLVAEHWDRHRPELYRRLDAGLPLVPLAL